MLLYLILFRPFKSKICNLFMVINELNLIACLLIFFWFIQSAIGTFPSVLGWILIALVVSNTLLNLGVIWIQKFVFIYKMCREKRSKVNQRPNRNAKEGTAEYYKNRALALKAKFKNNDMLEVYR